MDSDDIRDEIDCTRARIDRKLSILADRTRHAQRAAVGSALVVAAVGAVVATVAAGLAAVAIIRRRRQDRGMAMDDATLPEHTRTPSRLRRAG